MTYQMQTSEAPLERFQRKWAETHLSYEAIAALYVPEGYTIEYRKSLSGVHSGARKLIQAPRPTTPDALYIFLHECAHAHLQHVGRKPRHVEEMEAEQWAHTTMAKHGIAVSTKMTRRAQDYVAEKIHRARCRGAKAIDPRAIAFAGKAALVWEYGAYSATVMNGLEQVGRYTINPVGPRDPDGGVRATSYVVEWKPKRPRVAERVGVASSWQKAVKIVETDHKYRFPMT